MKVRRCMKHASPILANFTVGSFVLLAHLHIFLSLDLQLFLICIMLPLECYSTLYDQYHHLQQHGAPTKPLVQFVFTCLFSQVTPHKTQLITAHIKTNSLVYNHSIASCSGSIHQQQRKFNATYFLWWHVTVSHQTARPYHCSYDTKLRVTAILGQEKRHVRVKRYFDEQFALPTAFSSIGKVPAPIIQSGHGAAAHRTSSRPLFIEEANLATKRHNQCMLFLLPLVYTTFVATGPGTPAIRTIENAATLIQETRLPKPCTAKHERLPHSAGTRAPSNIYPSSQRQ